MKKQDNALDEKLSPDESRRKVPHSDSSDAIPYPLSDTKDTFSIGKDTITVSVAETPAHGVVGMPVYTSRDTVYQYYRGVNAAVTVFVNQDTVLTQDYAINDVLDAHDSNLQHSEFYVLTGIRILVESDSTRVAIRPAANIPDTDARLFGKKQYVYPETESSLYEHREPID